MQFFIGKKSTQHRKFQRLWQRRKRLDDFVGRVGGRGGVTGRIQRRGYVAGEHPVKDSARRSEAGGGYLQATASSSDLRLFGLCVWGFGFWVCGFVLCVFGGVGLSR